MPVASLESAVDERVLVLVKVRENTVLVLQVAVQPLVLGNDCRPSEPERLPARDRACQRQSPSSLTSLEQRPLHESLHN